MPAFLVEAFCYTDDYNWALMCQWRKQNNINELSEKKQWLFRLERYARGLALESKKQQQQSTDQNSHGLFGSVEPV